MANPLDILTGAGTALGVPVLTAPGAAAAGKVNDALNPDQKAKLSAVLARTGWGAADSELNQRARTIVKRESNGNPKARNPSGATGLFQMMTPLHCGNYGTPKPTAECIRWLEDPDNNARAAKALHSTAGWQPWAASGGAPAPTTWDPDITTDKDSILGGIGEVASAAVSPFSSVAGAAADIIGSLLSPDTWFRIGKTWLGAVFVITGTGALVFIVANQASGGRVASAAKLAATKGAIK